MQTCKSWGFLLADYQLYVCTVDVALLGTSVRHLPLPLPRAILELGMTNSRANLFAPLIPFSY